MTKKKLPLISVTMATYNRAHLLPQAIESILNQTFTDFEFIIIDDGSKDSTQDVLQNYQKQDSRMVICQQPNSGSVAARNHGLRLAQGKYIALMDDDDFSMPKRLEKQLSYLENHPTEMGCTCFYYVTDTQGQIINKHHPSPLKKFSHHFAIPCPLTLSPMAFIRKDAILTCNGWRSIFSSAQDLDLTLRFQEKFSAGVVKEFLYKYLFQDTYSQISNSLLINRFYCHILAYTSAWYRRYKGYDPLTGHQQINENLVTQLLHPLPRQMKKAIFNSASYMLKIKDFLRMNKEEIKRLFAMMILCDANPCLIRQTKRKMLWRLIQQGRWRDTAALWHRPIFE